MLAAELFLKKNLKVIFVAAILIFASIFWISASGNLSAQDKGDLCQGANLSFSADKRSCVTTTGVDTASGGEQCGANKDEDCAASRLNNIINTIINIFSIIVGVVAVIMLMVGGFRYITSGGDSGNVSNAKNTIIYAIVGLIIVALAQTIVKFVLNKVAI